MRNMMKGSIILLGFGLLLIGSTPSYADHVSVGVSVGVPVGGYYGYPYYPYRPAYVVASNPSFQPVVINGTAYYVNNGVYYIYTQYGYQSVATPAGASAPVVVQNAVTTAAPAAVDTGDSFTVNVPNDKGGYNSVVIKRSGSGFVGPQGEFYPEFPKISQLQVMYGK